MKPSGLKIAPVTPAQTARLAEAQADMPGVDMEEQPVRDYPFKKLGAHMLGYVGAIDEDEYRRLKGSGYSPNDVTGKDGLEQRYDRYLHGTAGGERVEVNASGAGWGPLSSAARTGVVHRRNDARIEPARGAGPAK